MLTLFLLAVGAFPQWAPDTLADADSLRRQQTVQLDPQALHFTPGHTTATLTFTNPSDTTRRAEVHVEFTYPDWPHGPIADTLTVALPGDMWLPHDTIIAHPTPQDRFAGRWLAGVPTSIVLAPHTTKHVTVSLHPPANLPAGEYWARIVTISRPFDPHHGGSLDTRKRYAVPTKRRAPLIQDTCAVTYRTGTLTMGLAIGPGARAIIDSTDVGDAVKPQMSHALWLRVPVKLTGNVPFRGQMHAVYHNVATGKVADMPHTKEFSLYKDEVLHWAAQTSTLRPGDYTLTLRFDNAQTDIPADQRVPMKPVEVTFHFTVKAPWQY